MKFQAVTMKREACFGDCPVYRVTILCGGFIAWLGKEYVKEEGQRTWSISQDKIDALEKAITKANFSDLDDKYTKLSITCSSTTNVTVKFEDGTVKKVEHYHGDFSTPSELKWLEDKIDEISGTAIYIGPSQ